MMDKIDHIVDDADVVIVVTMPKGDYEIMKEMIKDRKGSTFVWNKIKTFSLTISGVIAAWLFLGDTFIKVLKGVIK